MKLFLQSNFWSRHLGQLRHFLGTEVARSRHGVSLTQRTDVDLLSEIGVFECKPVDTPINPNTKLKDKSKLLFFLVDTKS